MSFKFRLEKVLNFRQLVVDRRSCELAATNSRVKILRQQLADMEEHLAELARRPLPHDEENPRVGLLDGRFQWGVHLHGLSQELDAKLAGALEDFHSCQAKLKESWRDLKVIQNLKERQQDQWDHEMRKRETRELNEVGQIQADRRSRSRLSPN